MAATRFACLAMAAVASLWPLALHGGMLEATPDESAHMAPEVRRLIDSLRTQFQKIEDYQVKITVSLKMPRLRMPRKRMTLSFKQPDLLHIKSRGFAMLPRRGIMLSPDSLFSRIADPVVIRSAGGGRCNCLVVRGEKELEGGQTQVTEVTIDTVRWVVLSVSTWGADIALFDMQSEYMEVAPGIFMPQKTSIKFELGDDFLTRGSRRRSRGGAAPTDADLSAILDADPDKAPRSAEAVLKFSRYRVNTGLKESLFEK